MFEVLQTDSRKGDIADFVNQGIRDNDIEFTETKIKNISKLYWKRYVTMKVKETALKWLVSNNQRQNMLSLKRNLGIPET